jgi:hypothetical protein
MKARLTLSLGALLLLSSNIACHAQQSQQPQQPQQQAQPVQTPVVRSLTKEQQAALDKQDHDIGQVASAIVKLIDEGKSGDVWDQGSPIAKRIISRDDFIRKITQDRAPLGAPGMRMPMGIKHYRYDGTGNMPAGAYINVLFDTQFTQARQSSREMVTFILDSDNIWRFVGYTVR